MEFKLSFPLEIVHVDSCPIKYTHLLIKKPPTTPHDFYCQELLVAKSSSLELKIKCQYINGILNTINVLKHSTHHFVFCGHTDAALVEEPTSEKFIGDTISFKSIAFSKSDPAVYLEREKNAIHVAQRKMSTLLSIDLNPQDNSSGHTTLQNIYLNPGDFFDNISSAPSEINFNIQYSNHFSELPLTALINKAIEAVTTDYNLTSQCGCAPYFSNPIVILILQGITDSFSQAVSKIPFFDYGGKPDSHFIAKRCSVVSELGLKTTPSTKEIGMQIFVF